MLHNVSLTSNWEQYMKDVGNLILLQNQENLQHAAHEQYVKHNFKTKRLIF